MIFTSGPQGTDIRLHMPPNPVEVLPPTVLTPAQQQVVESLLRNNCNEWESSFVARRGIAAPHRFLEAKANDLSPALHLPGVPQAIDLVMRERKASRPVYVASDFDVDGITASTIITDTLKAIGLSVSSDAPCRHQEGYGLNERMIKEAASLGCKLLFALDFGTSQNDLITAARGRGIDIVVIDHHKLPRSGPPQAAAFINPHQTGGAFCEMCAAGLSWMFARELAREFPDAPIPLERLQQLAAIGTVADVVALTGDNRILTRHALAQLISDPGIATLCHELGMKSERLSATDIAFQIGPALNAPGRMLSFGARECLELLQGRSENPAATALTLSDWNRMRKERVRSDFEIALKQFALSPQDRAVVVASDRFDPGVAGIVAAQLTEHLQRPSAVIAWCNKDQGRASVRSGEVFNAFSALDTLQQQAISNGRRQFVGFGGHAAAAGFTIRKDDFDSFRKGFIQEAQKQLGPPTPRRIAADFQLQFTDLCENAPSIISALERCGPFGQGNPAPLLYIDGVMVRAVTKAGAEHLVLDLTDGHRSMKGYLWRGVGHPLAQACGKIVALGCHLDWFLNSANGSLRQEIGLQIVGPGQHES